MKIAHAAAVAMYPGRMVGVVIDKRLIAATAELGDLRLSRVLLRDDSHFDWLVLVPRRAGPRQLIDLGRDDRAVLMEEIAAACEALRDAAQPEAVDVAIQAGQSAQLHAHVVGRRNGDRLGLVAAWERLPRRPLPEDELRSRLRRLRALLGLPRL